MVLTTLRNRFLQDKIYTASGDIIIAVNPYKRITPLYSKENLKLYLTSTDVNIDAIAVAPSPSEGEKLDPHVYVVARNAYSKMEAEFKNQGVIISGESGAGKTEVTKICLNYISMRSTQKKGADDISLEEEGVAAGLEKRLLSANPVFEAFGNAKTTR